MAAINGDLERDGFSVVEGIFSASDVFQITELISNIDVSGSGYRKTDDLFAIRQFLKVIPAAAGLIFKPALKDLLRLTFGEGYFVSKSIYFDKPTTSNWFVPWHQDLTISVVEKINVDGFGPWTVKQGQFAVQPPPNILADNFTLRIHLDEADEHNGALKVVPGSHLMGVRRLEDLRDLTSQTTCRVNAGDIMLMRPLLFHASDRTTNAKPRKVIHIEFSRKQLPLPLQWSERLYFQAL